MSAAQVIATERVVSCNFCGADQDAREFMIAAANDIHICERCIATCAEIIAEVRALKAEAMAAKEGK